MKGKIVGYNEKGDSGKQEITIALYQRLDTINTGNEVDITVAK